MSIKKKNNEILNHELNVNEKLNIIKNLLDSLEEILIIFYPLLERIFLMKEAKTYYKNGTLDALSQLFSKVSQECKKLTLPSFSSEILELVKDLSN